MIHVLATSIPTDFWTLLLAAGVLAMFATTVYMISGSASKKAAKPEALSPLRVATANAVRERAAAAARAKAAAAARDRVHELTDVREVPAGQTERGADGQQPQPAVSPEEAEAILAHYAEHDPNRLAEVIIQWIRSDVNNEAQPPS